MKYVLILILSLITQFALAFDGSSTVDEVVSSVSNSLDNKNYKLENESKFAGVLFLEKWPEDALLGLQVAILDRNFEITDKNTLGVWIDYVDPSGEYSLRGSILRSYKISLNKESVYVAIYDAFGGEWGREENLYLYYIISEKGHLLKYGRVEK